MSIPVGEGEDVLLERLQQMPPPQLEQILVVLKVPHAHLSASNQTQRAIDMLRYLRFTGQIDQLTQLLDKKRPAIDARQRASEIKDDTETAHAGLRKGIIEALAVACLYAFGCGTLVLFYVAYCKGPTWLELFAHIKAIDEEIEKKHDETLKYVNAIGQLLSVRTTIATNSKLGISESSIVAEVREISIRDFTLEKGDILVLGHITRDGKLDEIMTYPDSATIAANVVMAGRYTELVGTQVMMTDMANVNPSGASDGGFVSLTRASSIAPHIQRLIGIGITGEIVIHDKSTPIGEMTRGVTAHEWSFPFYKTKIIANEIPPCTVMGISVFNVGIGVLGLGLLSLFLAWAIDGFRTTGELARLNKTGFK